MRSAYYPNIVLRNGYIEAIQILFIWKSPGRRRIRKRRRRRRKRWKKKERKGKEKHLGKLL
jgi:hypothetical protein